MKQVTRVLAVLCILFAFFAGGMTTASAQSSGDEIVATDFIDPATGEVDLEAYLAAVAAANQATGGQQAAAGGTLPATGSSSADVAAVAFAMVAVGGGALALSAWARRARPSA